MKKIFIIVCCLSWISCQQQHQEKESHEPLSTQPAPPPPNTNTAPPATLLFHVRSNAYIGKILTDLHIGKDYPSDNLLLFVCTEMDCNTCVNDQLTLMTRVLKKETWKKQAVLVTTPQHLQLLKSTWEKVLQQWRVELRSVAALETIYQYQHQPIYYLVSAKKQTCLHAFPVEPGATELANEMVQTYHKLYLE